MSLLALMHQRWRRRLVLALGQGRGPGQEDRGAVDPDLPAHNNSLGLRTAPTQRPWRWTIPQTWSW